MLEIVSVGISASEREAPELAAGLGGPERRWLCIPRPPRVVAWRPLGSVVNHGVALVGTSFTSPASPSFTCWMGPTLP